MFGRAAASSVSAVIASSGTLLLSKSKDAQWTSSSSRSVNEAEDGGGKGVGEDAGIITSIGDEGDAVVLRLPAGGVQIDAVGPAPFCCKFRDCRRIGLRRHKRLCERQRRQCDGNRNLLLLASSRKRANKILRAPTTR